MSDPSTASRASAAIVALDALIIGGGGAGLWTLDHLTRLGYCVLLLESDALGAGQTVASQGIIHGGLKYTLLGGLTASAEAISQMPAFWRDCLAGKRQPDLSATELRTQFCHLWRTDSLSSRMGMVGARVGLAVAPQKLDHADWPAPLANCPGGVYRLDEQVIRPDSFIRALANRNPDRMLLYDPHQIAFDPPSPGQAAGVRIVRPASEQTLTLAPRALILAAGQGNASLLELLSLDQPRMQRRPLQMVMARGELPELNGHCVDGAKTRVTITTDSDHAGRRIWQLGGQVSEDGVTMQPRRLIAHAISETRAVLPGIDLGEVEWATYRVDRAELLTPNGKRPDDVTVWRTGNVITAWPTKLALVPRLAQAVAEQLGTIAPAPAAASGPPPAIPPDWPRPGVALPPWETCQEWFQDS